MNVLVFDWDQNNISKVQKHGLKIEEIEEFLNSNPFVRSDDVHSSAESRFIAFGKYLDRHLYISLTIRAINGVFKMRVISARFANKKEVERFYG